VIAQRRIETGIERVTFRQQSSDIGAIGTLCGDDYPRTLAQF
jgi:hypothetical protein